MRFLLLLLLLATPVHAQSLEDQVRALFAATPGTRVGLVVADEAGRELVAIAPDERFMPASNTKLFSTAAALAVLPVDGPDTTGGAAVRLEGGRVPDVILVGNGDARLSSAPDCVANCLAALADAIAKRTRTVRDVTGDDTLFPDERWGAGMAWEDIPTRSGTAASALSLDDNELVLTVTPGAPVRIDAPGYLTIDNRVTIGRETDLSATREINARAVRVTGTIAVDATPQVLRFGIDDPAHYAAWRLREQLIARGVRVTGTVRARHRPLAPGDDPAVRKGTPPARPPAQPVLAKLTPPPLGEDVMIVNKASQNLHAELLLRRAGLANGAGSIADGRAVIERMLAEAGVERWRTDLFDGSGMSTYNRVTPRGVVRFLGWTKRQPWSESYRRSLPIAATDGTLRRRFAGTPLAGKLFAKTGTFSNTNALAGWITAASGRTLTFAIYASDMPHGQSATKSIDAALGLVAAAN